MEISMTELSMNAADAVRGYLVTLRRRQGISQSKLARAMGLGRRTLIDYETGESADVKTDPLLRAIAFLHGSFGHLAALAKKTTAAEGEAIAEDWLRQKTETYKGMTDEGLLAQALTLDANFEAVLDQIRHDPALVAQLRAYAEGLVAGLSVDPPSQQKEAGVRGRWLRRRE